MTRQNGSIGGSFRYDCWFTKFANVSRVVRSDCGITGAVCGRYEQLSSHVYSGSVSDVDVKLDAFVHTGWKQAQEWLPEA